MLDCVEKLTPSTATAPWMQNMRDKSCQYRFITKENIKFFGKILVHSCQILSSLKAILIYCVFLGSHKCE